MSDASSNEFYYSNKYYDDQYEYRHVHIPKELLSQLPKNRLLSEAEWRAIGVQQSQGWVHYMIHSPERHILLFRRPLRKDETEDNRQQPNEPSDVVNVRG